MSEVSEKYSALLKYFQKLGRAAVAFSGGVDSSLLLFAAHEALGEDAFAVTARSVLMPSGEGREAEAFCREHGIVQLFVDHNDLALIRFNPADRCYICKRALLGKIVGTAKMNGAAAVAEGTNLDDLGDYRPGMKAVAELGVMSPLKDCGFTKSDIRELSRRLGMPTAGKPSMACLASRFAYGEELTPERLQAVDRAETYLREKGFDIVRVRVSGAAARIEVPADRLEALLALREEIVPRLKETGFVYISLDLQGFRTGSSNEALPAG